MPFDDSATSLLCMKSEGLYCPMGDFFIDPQKSVERALITHGHSDHARPFMKSYLTSEKGRAIVQERVGKDAKVEGCLLYTSPSPRDRTRSRMPSSA